MKSEMETGCPEKRAGFRRRRGARPAPRRRVALGAWLVWMSIGSSGWAGAEEALPEPVEPEVIDIVYRRLVEQRRTLEAVVEIVERLESVSGQAAAARALLSDDGEPTERLKRALEEVASGRPPVVGEATAPVVVAAPATVRAGPAGETPQEIQVEVVYAQQAGDGGSVVLAARDAHYPAEVGRSLRIGDDVIEVLAVGRDADGTLVVELRVNGAVLARRVRG